MKRFAFAVAAVLLSLGFAGEGPASSATRAPSPQQSQASHSRAKALKTFTSKAGFGTKVRVSKRGNVIGFASPSGVDHLNAGQVSEGYVLCYDDPNTQSPVNAYDVYDGQSGFGAALSTPSPFAVTRKTSDGYLRFTQTFSFDGLGRSLRITMSVTNLSSSKISGVSLRRQADIDADAGGPNGSGVFDNLFGTTTNSVFAYNDSSGVLVLGAGAHGLVLRLLATDFPIESGAATSQIDDSDCSPGVYSTPAGPVDLGASFTPFATVSIAPGATLNQTVEYDVF